MSPVKISAIKTHVPTISRIAASTAHLNNFIGKQSRRSLSRGFSDGTDDEDQIMANVDWDEGDQDQSDDQYDNQQPSDDELPPPRRTEPTEIDSASDDEDHEEPPAPPKSVKSKTVKSVKGEKQSKPAEKAPKKPASTKKQAKSDDDDEEKPTVKAKTAKKLTASTPAPKTNKKAKDEAPPEKKQTAKTPAKKPSVKAIISEESASIGFENDEDDAKVMEKSKKSEDSNEKSNKRAKPKVEDKEPTAESKNSRVRRPQLPKIKPASSKKAKTKPVFTDAIDRNKFIEYRNLIAPFFNDVNVGTKDEPEMVSIEDRYETMDAFYGAAKQLAKKMQKEAGEDYSKYCIQVKKDKERISVLKYIDGDTDEEIESNIEGNDALKFFRMNPVKKDFDDEAVMAYLKGSFIDTVNILSVNMKPLSLLDYDRLTQFSFYNDVEYTKESDIKFDLPKYVDLIKNLHKWTMTKVFDARSNFLTLIPEADREKLWRDAVKRFDEYLEQEFDDDRVIAIMEIFNKLMHSEYFKRYLMFGAIPNALFEKIFKNFLDTPANKEILIELFTGPLESIGFLFTPFYFDYRDVEYGNDGVNRPTFDDLVKITDDPDMYDPRTAIWIAKMV